MSRDLWIRLIMVVFLLSACAAPSPWMSRLSERARAEWEGASGAEKAAALQVVEITALMDAYGLVKFARIPTADNPWPPLDAKDDAFRMPLDGAVRMLQTAQVDASAYAGLRTRVDDLIDQAAAEVVALHHAKRR